MNKARALDIYEMAKELGARYPTLVAAQWALESGWGEYTSGKNNYFGIKGKGTVVWTTEWIKGQKQRIRDEFMDFATPFDCIKWLVDKWYKDYKQYKGVNNAKTQKDAAKMLVTEGYATDPMYANKLIRLCHQIEATVLA